MMGRRGTDLLSNGRSGNFYVSMGEQGRETEGDGRYLAYGGLAYRILLGDQIHDE